MTCARIYLHSLFQWSTALLNHTSPSSEYYIINLNVSAHCCAPLCSRRRRARLFQNSNTKAGKKALGIRVSSEFLGTINQEKKMIEVVLNDRLGKKVRVKCNDDDTIGDLKKLVAAQTGTRADKIRIQKWYTIYKDHITLKLRDPRRHGSRALLQLKSLFKGAINGVIYIAGAVLASMMASYFLGAYVGVIAYQESSFVLGLRFIIAALALYDEYSNDILDMPEGSCFPSFYSTPLLFVNVTSLLKLLSWVFPQVILDSIGLNIGKWLTQQRKLHIQIPSQDTEAPYEGGLLRPAKANATGILIKQFRAEQLSPPEEDYLCKLVLLSGDSERLKNSSTAPAPVSEVKRAELDALARRSKSGFARMVSFKSLKGPRNNGSNQGSEDVKDVESKGP
ncbi:hypothetical protein AHAS_Ahas16G0256900 [Arachis hypogaea]